MNHSWAPLLAVILWSGNIIVTKLSAGLIDPGAMGFYRCCVAILIMSPFLLPALIRNRKRVRESLPKQAVLALFGITLYQGLSYLAANATTATNMGIITSFVPLVTVVLSSIVLQERFNIAAGIGSIVSFFGLFILVAQGKLGTVLANGVNYGDGLMLAAAVFYSLYCILLRKWSFPLSLWESLYIQSICATLQFLPIYFFAPSSNVSIQNLPLILYAGGAASVVAPLLWMRGVASLGPARASTFMNLFPLTTALIAIVVLKETIQSYHVVGGLLTLIGVAVAQVKLAHFRGLREQLSQSWVLKRNAS
jgi:drug/metabolite transporter (DMT)-like permease